VQQQKMTHKQFPALEFTRVNAKGTCFPMSLRKIVYVDLKPPALKRKMSKI